MEYKQQLKNRAQRAEIQRKDLKAKIELTESQKHRFKRL